jgi:hypothetical protein
VSTPTTERLTTLPHHNIADALRALATMFDHGDMPAMHIPDQASRFDWHVSTAAAVRELAARLGVEVDEHEYRGAVHMSFEYGIGTGVADSEFGVLPYSSALVLRVVHVGEVAR